ncbi:taurine dioxygenase [Bradyrhizobium sp. cir1]|uniref:TauD/TfdA dioxygenase family protein n=1 Tax=Bradyrhizobium sp. cir1 TaxID=1445730 RepID=UPI001857109A|nr:TauD/TfdA family dioxygenase [Bradyrhizobium sp. cir1]MBB4373433.1 taurine dioxygenase [Bradyrhizobium sp. cir1]
MAVDNIILRANVVKYADRLGAEIKNITLSDDLPDDVIVAFRQLLLEHKVIFFRDQDHLDDAQQQRFVLRLGSLTPNLTMADTMDGLAIRPELPDRPWTDLNQMHDEPVRTAISVLRLAAVPTFGGDIAWSSRAAAYLDLPDSLRMLADNLWAVSFGLSDLTAPEKTTEPNERPWCGVSTGTIYETAHPIVRVHPETGDRMLSLGRSVKNFVGMQRYPSQRLFERLQSYLIAPRNTLCWNWKSGDVVIWDNRATEPYPVSKSSSPHWMVDQFAIDTRVPHVKSSKTRAAKAA